MDGWSLLFPKETFWGKQRNAKCFCFGLPPFWVQIIWLIKKAFVILVPVADRYETPRGGTRKHSRLHCHQMVIMVSICLPASRGLGVVSPVVVRNVGLTGCQLRLPVSHLSCNHLSAANLVHDDFYITRKQYKSLKTSIALLKTSSSTNPDI